MRLLSPFGKLLARLYKLLVVAFIAGIVLVGGLWGLGYVFQDEIEAYVAQHLTDYLHADVRIADIETSFLTDWPRVQVELKAVTTRLPTTDCQRLGFQPDTLLAADAVSFSFDFFSVFSDKFELTRLELDRPRVRLQQRAGLTDWAVMLAPLLREDTATRAPVTLNLHRVRVKDGTFVFQTAAGPSLIARGLRLDLQGELAAEHTNLELAMGGNLAQLSAEGTTWVQNQAFSLQTVLNLDSRRNRYRIASGALAFAGLRLDLHGEVLRQPSGSHLALHFATGEVPYAHLLLVLPPEWQPQTDSVRIGGSFALHGQVVGPVGAGQAPKLQTKFRLQAARVQSKHQPAADLYIPSASGALVWDFAHPATGYLHVDSLRGRLGPDAFTANGRLTNLQAPYIQLALAGAFDLARVAALAGFPAEQQLSGRVAGEFSTAGNWADYTPARIGRTETRGEVVLNGVSYRNTRLSQQAAGFNGRLAFTPYAIQVKDLAGEIGGNAIRVSGALNNYLGYALSEETLVADVSIRAGKVLLDPWLRPNKNPNLEKSPQAFQLPQHLNLALDVRANELVYDGLHATNVRGQLNGEGEKWSVTDLHAEAFGGVWEGRLELAAGNLDAHLKLDRVEMRETFAEFTTLARQSFIGPYLSGRLSARLHVQGSLKPGSLALEEPTLRAKGNVELHNGRLTDFTPASELSKFLKLNQFEQTTFTRAEADFQLTGERFVLDSAVVHANRFKMHAYGHHARRGALDYHLQIQVPRNQAKASRNPEVRQLVEEQLDDSPRMTLYVWVTGTLEHPKFKLDKPATREHIRENLREERQELAAAARKAREEVFGEQQTEEATDWVEEEPAPLRKKRRR